MKKGWNSIRLKQILFKFRVFLIPALFLPVIVHSFPVYKDNFTSKGKWKIKYFGSAHGASFDNQYNSGYGRKLCRFNTHNRSLRFSSLETGSSGKSLVLAYRCQPFSPKHPAKDITIHIQTLGNPLSEDLESGLFPLILYKSLAGKESFAISYKGIRKSVSLEVEKTGFFFLDTLSLEGAYPIPASDKKDILGVGFAFFSDGNTPPYSININSIKVEDAYNSFEISSRNQNAYLAKPIAFFTNLPGYHKIKWFRNGVPINAPSSKYGNTTFLEGGQTGLNQFHAKLDYPESDILSNTVAIKILTRPVFKKDIKKNLTFQELERGELIAEVVGGEDLEFQWYFNSKKVDKVKTFKSIKTRTKQYGEFALTQNQRRSNTPIQPVKKYPDKPGFTHYRIPLTLRWDPQIWDIRFGIPVQKVGHVDALIENHFQKIVPSSIFIDISADGPDKAIKVSQLKIPEWMDISWPPADSVVLDFQVAPRRLIFNRYFKNRTHLHQQDKSYFLFRSVSTLDEGRYMCVVSGGEQMKDTIVYHVKVADDGLWLHSKLRLANLGIKGGLMASTLSNSGQTSFRTRIHPPRPNASIFYEIPFNKNRGAAGRASVGLSPEIGYSQRGAEVQNKVQTSRLRAGYIDASCPLAVNLPVSKKSPVFLRISAGPFASFKLWEKDGVDEFAYSTTHPSQHLEKFDFGFFPGFGIAIGPFLVEGRYFFGLQEHNISSEPFFNKSFSISVGGALFQKFFETTKPVEICKDIDIPSAVDSLWRSVRFMVYNTDNKNSDVLIAPVKKLAEIPNTPYHIHVRHFFPDFYIYKNKCKSSEHSGNPAVHINVIKGHKLILDDWYLSESETKTLKGIKLEFLEGIRIGNSKTEP